MDYYGILEKDKIKELESMQQSMHSRYGRSLVAILPGMISNPTAHHETLWKLSNILDNNDPKVNKQLADILQITDRKSTDGKIIFTQAQEFAQYKFLIKLAIAPEIEKDLPSREFIATLSNLIFSQEGSNLDINLTKKLQDFAELDGTEAETKTRTTIIAYVLQELNNEDLFPKELLDKIPAVIKSIPKGRNGRYFSHFQQKTTLDFYFKHPKTLDEAMERLKTHATADLQDFPYRCAQLNKLKSVIASSTSFEETLKKMISSTKEHKSSLLELFNLLSVPETEQGIYPDADALLGKALGVEKQQVAKYRFILSLIEPFEYVNDASAQLIQKLTNIILPQEKDLKEILSEFSVTSLGVPKPTPQQQIIFDNILKELDYEQKIIDKYDDFLERCLKAHSVDNASANLIQQLTNMILDQDGRFLDQDGRYDGIEKKLSSFLDNSENTGTEGNIRERNIQEGLVDNIRQEIRRQEALFQPDLLTKVDKKALPEKLKQYAQEYIKSQNEHRAEQDFLRAIMYTQFNNVNGKALKEFCIYNSDSFKYLPNSLMKPIYIFALKYFGFTRRILLNKFQAQLKTQQIIEESFDRALEAKTRALSELSEDINKFTKRHELKVARELVLDTSSLRKADAQSLQGKISNIKGMLQEKEEAFDAARDAVSDELGGLSYEVIKEYTAPIQLANAIQQLKEAEKLLDTPLLDEEDCRTLEQRMLDIKFALMDKAPHVVDNKLDWLSDEVSNCTTRDQLKSITTQLKEAFNLLDTPLFNEQDRKTRAQKILKIVCALDDKVKAEKLLDTPLLDEEDRGTLEQRMLDIELALMDKAQDADDKREPIRQQKASLDQLEPIPTGTQSRMGIQQTGAPATKIETPQTSNVRTDIARRSDLGSNLGEALNSNTTQIQKTPDDDRTSKPTPGPGKGV